MLRRCKNIKRLDKKGRIGWYDGLNMLEPCRRITNYRFQSSILDLETKMSENQFKTTYGLELK